MSAPAPAAGVIATLTVPARADRLVLVRAVVRAALPLAGMAAGDDAAEELVLAVDEACQNVIRHAYDGRGDGEMTLALRHEEAPSALVVELADHGAPVDAAALPERDLDEVRPGGLGLHFIRSVMDGVEWVTPAPGGGNLLRLTRRLDGGESKGESPA